MSKVRLSPLLALALVALSCSAPASDSSEPLLTPASLDNQPESLERLVSIPGVQERMDAVMRDSVLVSTLDGVEPDLGRWSKPDIYSNGCHTSWSSTAVNVCYSGSDAGPLIVSAGDSHAAHFQPMLSRWAKERGWRYASITKAGCPAVKVNPVLAEESRLHLGLPYPTCSVWQRKLVKTLSTLHPSVVVLPLLSRRGLIDPRGLASWRWAIEQTASEIGEFSSVVILGDDPKVGFDVPSCLLDKKNPSLCGKSRSSAVLKDRLIIEKNAAEAAGAQWFDVSDWFCTESVCPSVVSNLVVRRDDNHLTKSFSEYLWPRVDQITVLCEAARKYMDATPSRCHGESLLMPTPSSIDTGYTGSRFREQLLLH